MKKHFTHQGSKIKKIAKHYGIPSTHVITWNLPSGWTCPGAVDCKSKANRETGKITDGPECKFRCYMASMEALYPAKREQVWRNLDMLRYIYRKRESAGGRIRHIMFEEYPNVEYVRIHSGGDFFRQEYFEDWCWVARNTPEVKFFAYTKRVDLWVKCRDQIPPNLHLVASLGGKWDDLAFRYNLRSARVTSNPNDPLPTFDDYMSEIFILEDSRSFALLIHGNQKKEYMDYKWAE